MLLSSLSAGLDVGRSEPVLFIFNRQNELLRMSTFVLPVAEIVLLLCDKMVWIALVTERRASGAWTSLLLPPGVPSVIVLVRIGQSRR